jgi:ubiquinone/menaquinone biosynthesis C-methylase UbiE
MVDSMNPEAQKNLKNSWDAFAKAYDFHMQKYMLQTFTTLAVHAKVSTRARILEVACGSGLHSLYLAKTMLRRGAALVSCDISEEMIRLAKGKFADPDAEYTVIPGNRADIEVEELAPLGKQDFDLEEHLKAGGFSGEKDRMVLARLANNECLPFKDGSFDCYLANLSLMLVDNHTNMLKEAIRVT